MNHSLGWYPINPKNYGELHKYISFYVSLVECQKKIHLFSVDLSEDYQSKHGPDRHAIGHLGVGLPIIHTTLLHAFMSA